MERPIIHDTFRLSKPSVPATAADIPVADDLRDTLLANRASCVGMAANMIGKNVRIIVFLQMGTPGEMFNPIIVSHTGPYETTEQCLSVPGSHNVTRYREINVEWQDRNFKTHRSRFVGLSAQIIQHEVDHLEGILV